MTRPLDSAIADAIGVSKKERKLAALIHYLCARCPQLAATLTPEERDALDAVAVVGGRAADDDTEEYLAAWEFYDACRKTMKKTAAVEATLAKHAALKTEKVWSMIEGRHESLRKLRKRRREFPPVET